MDDSILFDNQSSMFLRLFFFEIGDTTNDISISQDRRTYSNVGTTVFQNNQSVFCCCVGGMDGSSQYYEERRTIDHVCSIWDVRNDSLSLFERFPFDSLDAL